MAQWACPVCEKPLSSSSSGYVMKHADKKGELCRGVGRSAKDVSGASVGRGQMRSRERVKAVKKKPGKPSGRSSQREPSKAGREYWSLFGDVLQQDLEEDVSWLKVKLGPSQGAGRRR